MANLLVLEDGAYSSLTLQVRRAGDQGLPTSPNRRVTYPCVHSVARRSYAPQNGGAEDITVHLQLHKDAHSRVLGLPQGAKFDLGHGKAAHLGLMCKARWEGQVRGAGRGLLGAGLEGHP